jgi:hypothetical protein
MVEDDAALHRCVDVFVEHAENLRADGYSLNSIVQALQGAIVRSGCPPLNIWSARRARKGAAASIARSSSLTEM